MKKLLALILVLSMCFGMLVGCGSTGTTEPENTESPSASSEVPSDSQDAAPAVEHQTIAVMLASTGTESNNVKSYLENYVATLYDVDFIFSETVTCSEDELNFIENAYAAGARGLIAYSGYGPEAYLALCADLGMYVTIQGGKHLDGYPTYVGGAAGDVNENGNLYGSAMSDFLAEGYGEERGILICSGLSLIGNTAHSLPTEAVLTVLAEHFNFQYTEDIATLVASDSPTVAENSAGKKILIYPGTAMMDGFQSGLSSYLMTGEYDVVFTTTNVYTPMLAAVDEAEQALGFNIKMCAMAGMDADLETAMSTADSTGDYSLNKAVINITSVGVGGLFALVYNAMILDDSTAMFEALKAHDAVYYAMWCKPWICSNLDVMNEIKAAENPSANTWVCDADVLAKLVALSPDWTIEGMIEAYEGISQ